MILISIIIPVYNSEKYLYDCLNSIYDSNSNLTDFEVITVDDGSSDNSLSILKEYASKYSNFSVMSKNNEGQSIARNLAISKAQGEYLMFIDSDDCLKENAFSNLLAIIKKTTIDVDIIGYNAYKIDAQNDKKKYGSQIYPNERIIPMEDFMTNYTYQGVLWKYLFRRTVIIDNKIKMIPGIFHQDEAFVTQGFYFSNNIYFIDLDVYEYHIRENSSITKNDYPHRLKLGEDLFVVLDAFLKLKAENLIPSKYSGLSRKIKLYTIDIIISLLRYQLDTDYTSKKIDILKSNGLFPIKIKGLPLKHRIFALIFRKKTIILLFQRLGIKI